MKILNKYNCEGAIGTCYACGTKIELEKNDRIIRAEVGKHSEGPGLYKLIYCFTVYCPTCSAELICTKDG